MAMTWAIPSGIFAFMLSKYDLQGFREELDGVASMWSAFTFILGFLVVFRANQAYGRYWEGATLLAQARGEWFNAFSSVIAFRTKDQARQTEVESFQHLLVRLLSMLHCVALQTITDMADDDFETLDISGIAPHSLRFLASKKDHNQRMEILVQWIQRLVVENMETGVLSVPAPIVSRFFQEMSRGAVCLNRARNLTAIPFPFPYTQLLTLLLVLNCFVTPIVASVVMPNAAGSFFFTFVIVFSFWGSNYIAAEIESPFGDDDNDLPLMDLQEDVNMSLMNLLEAPAQCTPSFNFNRDLHTCCFDGQRRKGSFSRFDELSSEENLTGSLSTADAKLNSYLDNLRPKLGLKAAKRNSGRKTGHTSCSSSKAPRLSVSLSSVLKTYENGSWEWEEPGPHRVSMEQGRSSGSDDMPARFESSTLVAEEPSPQLPPLQHAEPFEKRARGGARSSSLPPIPASRCLPRHSFEVKVALARDQLDGSGPHLHTDNPELVSC